MARKKQRIIWIASVALAFALGWLVGRPDPPRRLSAEVMEQAVAATLREPDTLTRSLELTRLMEQLDPGNLPGAVAAVDAFIGYIEQADLRLFMHTWARFEPLRAFEHAQTWRPVAKQRYGVSEVAYLWALRGLGSEALEACLALPERLRDEAISGVVSGWAKSGDVEGPTQFVSSLNDGKKRDLLTTLIIAHQLNDEGPDAVFAWADGIAVDAPRRFKKTAFRKSVRHVTRRDPARAIAWLERHAGESYAQGATQVAATVWGDGDPEAALTWLRSRPTGSERDSALSAVVGRWLSRDAEAASAWIRGLERSADLDPAHAEYARWLSQTRPREAVEWTERIVDPERREKALENSARAWYAQAPAQAEVWLAESPLPEETRAQVRRTPRRRQARRLPGNVEIRVD